MQVCGAGEKKSGQGDKQQQQDIKTGDECMGKVASLLLITANRSASRHQGACVSSIPAQKSASILYSQVAQFAEGSQLQGECSVEVVSRQQPAEIYMKIYMKRSTTETQANPVSRRYGMRVVVGLSNNRFSGCAILLCVQTLPHCKQVHSVLCKSSFSSMTQLAAEPRCYHISSLTVSPGLSYSPTPWGWCPTAPWLWGH